MVLAVWNSDIAGAEDTNEYEHDFHLHWLVPIFQAENLTICFRNSVILTVDEHMLTDTQTHMHTYAYLLATGYFFTDKQIGLAVDTYCTVFYCAVYKCQISAENGGEK